MPTCAEQQLLQRARAGDRFAFDALRALLEAPVRRFIFRLVGRSEAEEDIFQDAFLALYLNLERIEPGERLRPFLFRVVRNRCYDELRRGGRFQRVSLEEDPDGTDAGASVLVDPRPPPDEAVQSLLLLSEVQQAMERLPELQRQALILYSEEKLTYTQIAEAMASDVGTVKSRIHYARKNLVKLLRPETLAALGIEAEGPYGTGTNHR
jgi:RNA polymerase sigma-70 factor (ECF subfamily)